VKLFF